jgi:mRNA interferase RelE/StbE
VTYRVLWSPTALKELERLPKDLVRRIVAKVGAAGGDPHRFLERLVDDPGYKLRVGEHRVLIDVLTQEHALAVRHIGHRHTIYDRKR